MGTAQIYLATESRCKRNESYLYAIHSYPIAAVACVCLSVNNDLRNSYVIIHICKVGLGRQKKEQIESTPLSQRNDPLRSGAVKVGIIHPELRH